MSDLTDMMTEQVQRDILDIADGLHKIADDVERYAATLTPDRLVDTAHGVQHRALWGLANLGLDNFGKRAAEAAVIAEREKADA